MSWRPRARSRPPRLDIRDRQTARSELRKEAHTLGRIHYLLARALRCGLGIVDLGEDSSQGFPSVLSVTPKRLKSAPYKVPPEPDAAEVWVDGQIRQQATLTLEIKLDKRQARDPSLARLAEIRPGDESVDRSFTAVVVGVPQSRKPVVQALALLLEWKARCVKAVMDNSKQIFLSTIAKIDDLHIDMFCGNRRRDAHETTRFPCR